MCVCVYVCEISAEQQKVEEMQSGKTVKIGQKIGNRTSGIHGTSVSDLCHSFRDFPGQCFGSVVVV